MAEKVNCVVSGKDYPIERATPLSVLDKNMLTYIHEHYPNVPVKGYLGDDQLLHIKKEYLNQMLASEFGELDELEKEVITSISENKIISEQVEISIDDKLTLGDKISDRIAEFGGSWTFIISFFGFILVWIVANIWWLSNRSFDPYPFILLNLILSCLAAIQAPIIMMSQNRQETKDRARSEHDYKINLKAELEIQLLHKKMDHLLIHQSKIQTEMMEAVLGRLPEKD